MPVKIRLVKGRRHRITDAAIEAYRRGDQVDLHRALGLRLWEISPLDANTPEPPVGCGPNDAWRESWPLAWELRAELEAAIAEDM